jgi:hypothetical protein
MNVAEIVLEGERATAGGTDAVKDVRGKRQSALGTRHGVGAHEMSLQSGKREPGRSVQLARGHLMAHAISEVYSVAADMLWGS